jgi:hypothetical protein
MNGLVHAGGEAAVGMVRFVIAGVYRSGSCVRTCEAKAEAAGIVAGCR